LVFRETFLFAIFHLKIKRGQSLGETDKGNSRMPLNLDKKIPFDGDPQKGFMFDSVGFIRKKLLHGKTIVK
jgi:hypothetical protein